jgi:ABC-type sugar transport system permease subunit
MLPAVALIGFVFIYPIYKLLYYSFQTRPNAPDSVFTRANYTLSWSDPNFSAAIKHNLLLLTAVPILTVLALFFAILVFKPTKSSHFYRSALFLPYVLSIPVVGVAFSAIYALHGPANDVLSGVGLKVHDFLGDPRIALWAIMSVIIWKEFGFGLLLFSARMASIDTELYDAARVDGAGWWAQHRHVTLPDLRQIIQFFIIVETITMLNGVFGYVFTMTHGGPGGATTVMEYQIWTQAFVSTAPGLAAATAMILLGATVTLLLVLAVLGRRRGGSS